MRPIHEVIRASAQTAQTERANWEGRTAQAKFEGAAAADRQAVAFGKRKAR